MRRTRILISLSAVVLPFFVFFPFQIPFYRDVYNNVVLDNYDHWLPCSKLPVLAQVEATMSQNRDTLERIKVVDPTGRPGIIVNVAEVCKGRGDIEISYGAHRHRVQIEAILGNQTFFGIPVRLRNV